MHDAYRPDLGDVPADPEALTLAVALLVAQFGVFGTVEDREALFRDLQGLVTAHPGLRDTAASLLLELPEAIRWRDYHRAEAAAAAWVRRRDRERRAAADLRRR